MPLFKQVWRLAHIERKDPVTAVDQLALVMDANSILRELDQMWADSNKA